MAKLYFKYGAMGSSKTAQALITKFNYEERGMKVWLIKPSLDDRDGALFLKSRIGLEAQCTPIKPEDDIFELSQKLVAFEGIDFLREGYLVKKILQETEGTEPTADKSAENGTDEHKKAHNIKAELKVSRTDYSLK